MSANEGQAQSAHHGWAHLRTITRNPISLLGLAIAVVALANILFLALIDMVSERSSPYIGILGYMVMPGFLIAGSVLIAFGYWRERRRKVTQGTEAHRYPCVDLNDPD